MRRILKHSLILGPMVGFAAMVATGTAWAQETQTKDSAADTTVQDSSKWGHETSRNPEVQNPLGYRGMERPVNVFPADSGKDTTTAGEVEDQVTGTYEDSAWQDTSGAVQNPPGYRGMERPVGTDSVADTSDTTGKAGDTTGMGQPPEDTIRLGETEPKTPESPDPRMADDSTGHRGHQAPADTSGP